MIESPALSLSPAAVETALSDPAQPFRAIFEQADVGLVVTDVEDGTILVTNPAYEELLGYSKGELRGTRFLDHTHPDDRPANLELWETHCQTAESYRLEKRYVRRDGSAIWVEVSGTFVGDEDGRPRLSFSVVQDISARQEADEALRQSEERLRLALEAGEMAAWERDGTSTEILWTGGQPEKVFGIDSEDLPDTPGKLMELVHPDDCDRVARAVAERTAGRGGEIEYRVLAANGTVRWIASRTTALPGASASSSRIVGVCIDITARKNIEEELRTTNDLLESLVAACPLAIVDTGVEGHVTMWNRSAEGIFGWEAGEVLGRPLPFVAPEDESESRTLQGRVLAGETLLDVEMSRLRKDGSRVDVSTSLAPRRAADGRVVGILEILADAGERLRAKQQLQRSVELLQRSDEERRRLLAELVRVQEEERRRIAAGIHDDTVQDMVAVGLRLALLRRSLDGAPADLVGDLEASVSDAIRRLRQLLFELRPSELDRGGLASALRMSLEQVREEAGLVWRLEDRLAAEPPLEVRTTAYRIACEAIANVRRHSCAESVDVVLESVGDGMCVAIRDDGRGFSVAEDAGDGSADHTGLVEMRERAELAGGWLRIDTTPGGGTAIVFWLPAGPSRGSIVTAAP